MAFALDVLAIIDVQMPLDWSTFPPKSELECATPDRLRKLYRIQRSVPGYQSLVRSNLTIFGTFDGKIDS